MAPVAEHGLVAALRALRETVLTELLAPDGASGGDIHVEPHPDDARLHGVLVTRTGHPASHLIVLVRFLPTAIWAVLRIGIEPDVVTVIDPQCLRILRVDFEVPLAHPWLALVVAVDVAEGAEEQTHPVEVDRGAVGTVAILGRDEDEAVPVVACSQRVNGILQVCPRLDDVPYLARLRGEVVQRQPVHLGPGRGDQFVRLAVDHVRLVERGVHRLPEDREVLPVLPELGLVPVELQTPGAVVPGLVFVALLPASLPWVRPEVHQRGDA